MKAELRDNNQVEHIEVADPAPARLVRPNRIFASPEQNSMLPSGEHEAIYALHRVDRGVAIYFFHAMRQKP